MASLTITGSSPVLSGLLAEGYFGGIRLSWNVDDPGGTLLHIEIWASQTDDRTTAILYATVPSGTQTYNYSTGIDETWYFWIRGINIYGRYGDYYPPGLTPSSGTTGATAPGALWDAGTGTGTWTGALSTVQTQDATFRTATQDATNPVYVTNFYDFGFSSLDPNAHPTAIFVTIWGKVSSTTGTPGLEIELSWDGSTHPHDSTTGDVLSSNFAEVDLTATNTGTIFGGGDIRNVWGLHYDLYANDTEIITIANIRDPNFGIRVTPRLGHSGTIWSIDYVAITINWTKGTGVQGTSLNGTGPMLISGDLTIENNGKILTPYTNTLTVGDVTINEMAGQAIVASGSSSVKVTNAHLGTTSHIFATVASNDATAYVKNVTIDPTASAFFTIHLGAAATADTPVSFIVFN